MSNERIPDLQDGKPTGRYLAVAPDGRLAGIRDQDELKPDWRLATPDDVERKRQAAAPTPLPPEPEPAESAPSEPAPALYRSLSDDETKALDEQFGK